MKIVHAPLKRQHRLIALFNALALLLLLSISVAAQSTDMEYPTLVRSNELSGTIVPRDLGDPRVTRYFYSFTGTPGDLIVAVESRNLEGDVDVFTAATLRPLAKVSLYASGTMSSGSKTIYLKTREPLILRVEARTPNDNEGSFRIRFDGAFEPISNDIPDREPVVPTVSSTSKGGRRVTATGARIDEPEPAAETAKPEIETPTTPSTETPAPAETTTANTTTPAPPRPRTPRTRRTRTSIPRNPRTRPSPTARRTPTPVEPAPAIEPASGPRLIIELRDGMRVERYMTTVRRVTVENGQIVVITKDGKVERQPMSNVLRMAIEP
jgi:hypothetical protein